MHCTFSLQQMLHAARHLKDYRIVSSRVMLVVQRIEHPGELTQRCADFVALALVNHYSVCKRWSVRSLYSSHRHRPSNLRVTVSGSRHIDSSMCQMTHCGRDLCANPQKKSACQNVGESNNALAPARLRQVHQTNASVHECPMQARFGAPIMESIPVVAGREV